MADLLLQAMEARQKGDISQAKQLLAQAIVQDPHNEGAWMLMSEVVDEANLKRNCLQRVLLINPNNDAANIALMKLDTSPLGPVVRGERYKPVIPPKIEKTPPFTPPFTWTGDDAQFQNTGDMTYPDLTNEQLNQTPDTPTTFDWAVESDEPDKTIERIFDAVANPELATQPLPDTDLSWLEEHPTTGPEGNALSDQEKEAMLLDELVGPTADAKTQHSSSNPDDFKVSAAAQFGMEAFAATNAGQPDAIEPEPLLWDNPHAKTNRLVILGTKSIIFANPADSDMPHILGLFNEKKMVRDLLGENAGTIKLDTVTRLITNPNRSDLLIENMQADKTATHKLTFSDRKVRDEVVSALELRLGAGFTRRTNKFSVKDKILPPLLYILVVDVLGWALLAGLPLLSRISIFQAGVLQLIVSNIQYFIASVGAYTILMISIILITLGLIWLVVNLFKPTQLIYLEKK